MGRKKCSLCGNFGTREGGHLHCQYELISYGIPVEALPFDLRTGQYNNRSQKLWVQHRIEVEKKEAAAANAATAAATQQQQEEGSIRVSPLLGAEVAEGKPALIERDFNSKGDKQTKQNGVSPSTTIGPAAEGAADGSTKTTYILQPKPTDGTPAAFLFFATFLQKPCMFVCSAS